MLSKALIENAPAKPGVYLFKNRNGRILYIGKAKSLKARLRSYTNSRQRRKIKQLVHSTVKVDYVVCGSELEALLLESRLIKKHQPKYNVLLKESRPRPFVKMTFDEPFPRLLVDYEISDDGAKYFGPFPGFETAKKAIEIIQRLFPLRICSLRLPMTSSYVERPIRPNPEIRPCLEYHLGRCSAPCAGKINETDYQAVCQDVIRLISGRHLELLEDLVRRRDQAAAELNFEQAARIQERIELISRIQLLAGHNNNLAVICPSTEFGAVELFFIKSGKLHAQHRISSSDQATLEYTVGVLIADAFSSPASSQEISAAPFDKGEEISQLDLDAMNIISRWLYANLREQRIVALPNLINPTDTLAQMTGEVVRTIQSVIRDE
jgi:excinuclease UvrABC nuclease subunit